MLSNINYDILLEYFSAQKEGSWKQFKDALNNLDYGNDLDYYDYNAVQKMFTRLGHIEFDFEKRKYAVVPPTLLINNKSEYGILCGYRNRDFINKIKCKYKVIEEDNIDAPKIVKIKYIGINEFISDFASIRVSEDFSIKSLFLCNELYNIDKFYEETCKNVQDKNFYILNYPNCKYYDIDVYKSFKNPKQQNIEIGLFELSAYDKNKYYLKLNDMWYNIPNNDKQMGIFLIHYILNKRNLIKYSEEKKELYVSEYIYFPKLIDKCLTSLTGRNPKINKMKLRRYENIEPLYANKIAKILQQDLKEI